MAMAIIRKIRNNKCSWWEWVLWETSIEASQSLEIDHPLLGNSPNFMKSVYGRGTCSCWPVTVNNQEIEKEPWFFPPLSFLVGIWRMGFKPRHFVSIWLYLAHPPCPIILTCSSAHPQVSFFTSTGLFSASVMHVHNVYVIYVIISFYLAD